MKLTLKEVRQIIRNAIVEWEKGNAENLMLNKDSKIAEPEIRHKVKKWLKAMHMTENNE